MSFTGFYAVLLGIVVFYWVLLGYGTKNLTLELVKVWPELAHIGRSFASSETTLEWK